MKKLGISLTLGLVMVMILVLTGCSPSTGPSTSTPAASTPIASTSVTSTGQTIYMIGMENQYDVWLAMKQGGIECGAASGFNVIYEAAPGGEADPNGEIALVETAIQAKPAAIVLAANDKDALTPVCDQVKAAGIPLVLFIAGISDDSFDAFVALDDYTSATDIAKEICGNQLGGSGKIGFIGAVTGSQTLQNREKGYRDYIAQNLPGIEFVGDALYSNNDVQKAMNATYDLLTAHPEIKAILTVNTPTAEGVCAAVKELGRKDVLVGAFDSSDTLITDVAGGTLNALSVLDGYAIGWKSITCSIELIGGKPLSLVESGSKTVNISSVVVTPANYLNPDMQKVLYPFGKK